MENKKPGRYIERIIRKFAYFSSLSLSCLPAYAKNPLYILFLEHKEDSLLTRVAWGMVR